MTLRESYGKLKQTRQTIGKYLSSINNYKEVSIVDKYEYKLKTEQMLELMEDGVYNKAAEIADCIDWRRVRNANMLMTVGSIYEKNRDYQKSYEVLQTAYQRAEGSRKILYRLCTLAMKTGNLDEAIDYYDEFMKIAPKDPNQYILRYRLLRARRAPIEQQIHALEEFKKSEYIEEWAYELAKRYQEAGMTAECLEECDDLILWFSEGKYVYKAMELKMQYKQLTPSQQEKYDRRYEAGAAKEKHVEKLTEVSKTKAEEEKQRQEEQQDEPLSDEFVDDQVKKEPEETAKKKLGNTMKLGEALQSLFHPKKEESEEIELSEEDAEDYEEDVEDIYEDTSEEAVSNEIGEEMEEEEDLSDLEEEIEAIESIKDLELVDELASQEEESKEDTIQEDIKEDILKEVVVEEPENVEENTGPDDTENLEEAEVESMERESTKSMEEFKDDEQIEGYLDIDDILAEWEEAAGGEPEEELVPEVNAEDVEQIERKPKTPILSPEIQRMIDQIEGVIPDEEEVIPEPVRETPVQEEPRENKGEVTEQLRIDDTESEESLLTEENAEDYEEDYAEDYAEDYEEMLSEDEAEELDSEDYESITAKLEAEFKPNLSNEPDDREIPDEEDEPVDIMSATTPLSRKETAKLIATGKTAPLPMNEIADALSISDTGFLVHSRYDLSGQTGVKRGDLTEEQKKLFSYFVPVRGMSEQLVDVLEQDRNCTNRKGTSCTGNLLIIGNKGNGKTVLAVDVVKAIQKQRKIRQGRVAIITGESLNKKKISDIVAKLYGGALIIEKAGKLNEKTVAKLNRAMEKDTGEMLIVLEEQRKPLDRLLSSNREFRKKFTSRLEVPIFVNDELVTFGQTYAQENGYRIDEMGILALYSRIDALQREDHAVTVAEVKDIMDEAMAHSQKVSAKKLVKRVLGKNTDDADRIILSERDFTI